MSKATSSLSLAAGRVHAIASNTFREAVRHRAFIAMAAVGAGLLLFSMILSELAVTGQVRRVLLDFGLFATSLFGLVAAIGLGAALVRRDLERKTVYTLLSKPVPRYQFLLGKFAGMVGVIWLGLFALTLIWFLVLAWQGHEVSGELVKAIILIAAESLLVASIATMFSSMSSAIMTALLSGGVVVVGRLVGTVEGMLTSTSKRAFFEKNPEFRWVGELLTGIWPDLSVFNTSQQVLLEVPIPAEYVIQGVLYSVACAGIFLSIGVLAISRRDFV